MWSWKDLMELNEKGFNLLEKDKKIQLIIKDVTRKYPEVLELLLLSNIYLHYIQNRPKEANIYHKM